MKTVIALIVVSIGLWVALLVGYQHKNSQLRAAKAENLRLSDERNDTRSRLAEANELTEKLQSTAATRLDAWLANSNDLARAGAELAQAQNNLQLAQSELQTAQRESKSQQARIEELESQRDDLTVRMEQLNKSINSLDTQIADTQRKLNEAEGDRDTLQKELQRLMDEKAVLVAQFNNLTALRAQVTKLKEEAAIKQRLEWLRTGVYARQGRKGAEDLIVNALRASPPADQRLFIEVEESGKAKVVPPPAAAPQ